MSVLWDHLHTHTKPLQTHPTRSASQRPTDSSDASRAPLFLSREHLCPQDLCRTLSGSHIAACYIYAALARSAARDGLCPRWGGGRTPGQEPELSRQPRHHFAPGQRCRTACSLIPTRGGTG